MSQVDKANVRRWVGGVLFAAVLWTSLGFIFALPNLGMGPRKVVLLSALALWWSWGLLAFVIIAVDARLPFSAAQLGRRIAAHVFLNWCYFPFCLCTGGYASFAWPTKFVDHAGSASFASALRGMFLWNLLIYWVIAGGWQAYRYNQSYV